MSRQDAFYFPLCIPGSQASEFQYSTGKLVQDYEARTDSDDSDPAPCILTRAYSIGCPSCACQRAGSWIFIVLIDNSLSPFLSSAEPQAQPQLLRHIDKVSRTQGNEFQFSTGKLGQNSRWFVFDRFLSYVDAVYTLPYLLPPHTYIPRLTSKHQVWEWSAGGGFRLSWRDLPSPGYHLPDRLRIKLFDLKAISR